MLHELLAEDGGSRASTRPSQQRHGINVGRRSGSPRRRGRWARWCCCACSSPRDRKLRHVPPEIPKLPVDPVLEALVVADPAAEPAALLEEEAVKTPPQHRALMICGGIRMAATNQALKGRSVLVVRARDERRSNNPSRRISILSLRCPFSNSGWSSSCRGVGPPAGHPRFEGAVGGTSGGRPRGGVEEAKSRWRRLWA